MAYIGASPSNGVRRKHTYTATASQTTFSGAGAEGAVLSYRDSNYVDVYVNGVKLGDADYTATSGTSIVLGVGAAVNDIVEIIAYDVFSVADTVSKADGGQFDGNVTMAGTLGVTGVLTGTSLDISGDIDIDGTTNLDVVDIDSTLNVQGETTLQTHLNMGDNDIIKLGASADLQIYHDGSQSIIADVGTGDLQIRGADTALKNADGSESYILCSNNASVRIYYDNSKKLETTSTGIDVTGTAVTDGLTVAGNVSIDGGTIKLDGNYPTGSSNTALGNGALNGTLTGQQNTAIGSAALSALTSGNDNTAVGRVALSNNTTGSQNTATGRYALSANTTGSFNTALGVQALQANTTASDNTAVGYQSLYTNTTGDRNVAIGWKPLYLNTSGIRNVAVGYANLYSNTDGQENVALGYGVMQGNTTGDYNIAIGTNALNANTTASNNTAVGYQAGYTNTTAIRNTFIGNQAGYTNNGNLNTAVGHEALKLNSTGTDNVAIGADSLSQNSTGIDNTAVGRLALYSNTTASNNTAVGHQALYSNTTGYQNDSFGLQAGYSYTTTNRNTSFGYFAGRYQTGYYNTFIGSESGNGQSGQSTANTNVGVGVQTLYLLTTGNNNVAIGGWTGGSPAALYANTSGGQNIAIGSGALGNNTTASDNTAVGFQALFDNTTGQNNTIIGRSAGANITTATGNTFIGKGAGESITTGAKNTIIGLFNGNQGGLDMRTASGNIVLSDGDGNPRGIFDASGNFQVGLYTSGTTAAVGLLPNIDSGGFVGIDKTSSGGNGDRFVKFSRANSQIGTISMAGTTGVSYNTSSDHRLKENVSDMTGAIDRVKQLSPKRFNFIADDTDTLVDGFLAHEAQTVIPEAVTGTHNEVDEDGNAVMQGIDQSKIVPLLTGALKEAIAKIEDLETRIATLEGA